MKPEPPPCPTCARPVWPSAFAAYVLGVQSIAYECGWVPGEAGTAHGRGAALDAVLPPGPLLGEPVGGKPPRSQGSLHFPQKEDTLRRERALQPILRWKKPGRLAQGLPCREPQWPGPGPSRGDGERAGVAGGCLGHCGDAGSLPPVKWVPTGHQGALCTRRGVASDRSLGPRPSLAPCPIQLLPDSSQASGCLEGRAGQVSSEFLPRKLGESCWLGRRCQASWAERPTGPQGQQCAQCWDMARIISVSK